MKKHQRHFIGCILVVFVSLILFTLSVLAGPQNSLIYVNQVATGANDGTSWANAYMELRTALAVAGSGDEIWVAAGTYTPGSSRSDSFRIPDGVAVYGGFTGNETMLEQRNANPKTNNTVLSGDVNADDDPFILNTNDNSYHVVIADNTSDSTVLDGFVISGGYADGDSYQDKRGAGLLNTSNGNLRLVNLLFTNNTAWANGGGLANEYSSPTLTNIIFHQNFARENGGGMANSWNGQPELINVRFIDNHAQLDGGGLCQSNSGMLMKLSNVRFIMNVAGSDGGGIVTDGAIRIENGVFYSNHAQNYGGAMVLSHEVEDESSVINAVFVGNTASEGGAIFNTSNTNAVFVNVTFSDNVAAVQGGALYNKWYSHPIIQNSIFWDNQAPSGPQIANNRSYPDNSQPVISYSLIAGSNGSGSNWDVSLGVDAGNNVDSDPKFILYPDPGSDGIWYGGDDDYGDLRLNYDSPARNSGDNDADTDANIDGVQPLPVLDLDGSPRIINRIVDIGAYESTLNRPPVFDDHTFYVAELSPVGTVVGTVIADDPDHGDVLTYSIIEENSNKAFSISAEGFLTVQDIRPLDFETNPSFALTVQVTDGSLSDTATVTILLIDRLEMYLVFIIR